MMKKVTMLVMVMAMALVVPALGYVEDNPPAWAEGENTATATWDFSAIDGITYENKIDPTCLEGTASYMAALPPEGYEGDIDELLVGDSVRSSLWYSVALPDVEGEYVTVRTQLHLADGSEGRDFAESKFSYDVPTFADEYGCFQGGPEIDIQEGLIIITQTVSRYEGECEGGIASAGGWIPGTDGEGEADYAAIVVDIIVHDDEAPPEDGPRFSTCFLDPTIVIDGVEIEEEGPTSADLTIQLYKNALADVTFTISGPLWETDPNYPDPETFWIADPNEGVATVVVPADSNSVTFTVTAFDDETIEGNLGYQLAVESTMEAGPGYDPNLVTGDIAVLRAGAVTVIDNDVRMLVIDNPFANEEGILQLSENDDPNTWVPVYVTLSHEPAPGTVVNVDLDIFEWGWDMGMVKTDGDLDDPNALTFDETDWNIPQTISFAAIDNEILAEVGVFELEAVCSLNTSSDDPTYQELPGQNIIITIEEKACGGRGYDFRDINEDCYVTVDDLAIFVENWLNCTDIKVDGCIE